MRRLISLLLVILLLIPSLAGAEDLTSEWMEHAFYSRDVVGGAVVTQADADRIGADHYGKDAAQAAKIAEKVFSKK